MITANDIKNYLDSLFPFSLAMDWDNVGILVGRENKIINKILLTLDVDEKVVAEAVESGCDMIISHHPLMFRGIKQITDNLPESRTIKNLILNDITLLSAHTNLDSASGGLNDFLAKKLGITNCKIIEVTSNYSNQSHGFGRIGNLDVPCTLKDMLAVVSKTLNTSALRYTGSLDKIIKTVAVNCGGGSDILPLCINAGADLFITGDVKYNPFRDAYDNQIALVDAGHHETEKIVLDLFEDVIKKGFPRLFCTKSTENIPVIKYYINEE